MVFPGATKVIPNVIEARHVKDYRVWLRFQDGTEGEIDLKNELWGEVFEALKDVRFFQKLRVCEKISSWFDRLRVTG